LFCGVKSKRYFLLLFLGQKVTKSQARKTFSRTGHTRPGFLSCHRA
jgi:hypothetical protein